MLPRGQKLTKHSGARVRGAISRPHPNSLAQLYKAPDLLSRFEQFHPGRIARRSHPGLTAS